MFLEQTKNRNPKLIKASFEFHQNGLIEPDSYVIDVDTFLKNAGLILKEAKRDEIRLFFMLKQVGRNPYLARKLVQLGYEGAVVVDYREAEVMMKHHIPIGNVGHLVQIPTSKVKEIVAYKPKVITVYSKEKVSQINSAAKELGLVQDILIRVYNESDMIYSGQTAGIPLADLKEFAIFVKNEYSYVNIVGVTSFPCYQYSEEAQDIMPTENLNTVKKAVNILEEVGVICSIINTPSTTCVHTLQKFKKYGGNCGEPGHGLSGTTPLHAYKMQVEIPCVTYVSEISHNFMDQAYCFGGGHYRRSHVKNALVGSSMEHSKQISVYPPEDGNIDYHFMLSERCNVGDTVIMAFRFQIFVTRSNVILLEGLKTNKPAIVGQYNSLGTKLD